KSISITKAEEEEAARQVHATHAIAKELSEYSEEDLSDEEEIDWIDSKEDDEKKDDIDDDKSIDLEMTDDEETDDEADAEKTEEAKDDSKNAELPPTSSSLSISSDAKISSLLDIKIQYEVPHIQSSSMLKVPMSMISKPSVLSLVQETPSATAVTTLPPPSISTIPPAPLQQSIAPILLLPITTDALTITTNFHESDALSAVQLRVAKLDKDVSELKKIDHSTKALATLKSQVPTFFEQLSKIQTSTINLEQESEKSALEILKIKKEQVEKQKMPKYTIKSTYKAVLKELYHALMEVLIEDENAMHKGVADIELESSKKPSTTKDTPKGKPLSKCSKTDVVHDDDQPQDTSEPKTAKTPNLELFKQPPRPPTPDLEWNKHQVALGQPEQPWFNQMVSAINDPLTFNDLMSTPIDFSKYVLNRLKIDNMTQDLLLGPAYDLLKGTCTSSIELEYNFQECFNALTEKLIWNNPEGDRCPFDLSNPIPLQGRPGHLTIAADYFFNNDLEYLKSFDSKRTYTTSITKTKATRYEIVGIEDMVPTLWSTIKHVYDKDAAKGIKHWGERHKLWKRS
ncbi:hypothetical protein Tco_1094999, partial [Tanacetum coccineum]